MIGNFNNKLNICLSVVSEWSISLINTKKVGQYLAELKHDEFTTNHMAVSKR